MQVQGRPILEHVLLRVHVQFALDFGLLVSGILLSLLPPPRLSSLTFFSLRPSPVIHIWKPVILSIYKYIQQTNTC
jgi:hypothetical protein